MSQNATYQRPLLDIAVRPPAPPPGRRPFDLYPTHEAITRHLLQRVDVRGRVVEPCAGPGDMARVLAEDGRVSRVITNDVDPQWACDFTGDACDPLAAIWQSSFDWCVTNPPFNVASAVLAQAMRRAQAGVAFLLRVTFVEPVSERGDWMAAHEDSMIGFYPLGQPRPSFTGDGNTDSTTAAWCVWRKGWSWDGMGIARPFQFVMRWMS